MPKYFLYKLAQLLALSMPVKNGYRLAELAADLYSMVAFLDRKWVADNLKAIFPEKGNREISIVRRQLFRNFAKYLVDFFRFDKLDMKYIKENIHVRNMHYVDSALTEGNGVILLTAHLGNWELGGVVISMLGYPFITVALRHKSKAVDAFFNRQRESKGVRVFPLGSAAKGCLRALKKNELLGLVGDRDFTGKGVVIDFFAKPSVFPLGPAAISLKTKARIIPGFMLRNKDDSFDLVMNKPIEYVPTGDNEKDIREILIRYKMVLEEYVRSYPEQWYMFRRFWKE
ncbi:MAG: lysophospholipid acyltransferase family protein [Candidatus Omnitrophota bacterium]|jgi:KDO2-lipid IV(A) lauroyltransferase